MDDKELLSLLHDLESDRVERKASISDRGRICEAICAFANDLPNHQRPGVLVVGVNDDGTSAGLPITDLLLRTLADVRSEGNILPLPAMTVQKRTLEGSELAVVVVQPSDAPPVRYKGRVWVRVGPRRAVATPEEERRLSEKRRAKDATYDLHPLYSASLQDLDLVLFQRVYLPSAVSPEVIEENQRSVEEQLMSLRFARIESSILSPTVVGALVLAKDPLRFLPGAYVQFLRIDGREMTDPITDQKVIAGPLPDFLRVLDDVVGSHIRVASDPLAQPVEARRMDYPLVALQQLIRNGVMHRAYDGTNAPVRVTWFNDRIEILNPGGPYGQVTRRNFGQGSVTDYRNPYLAEAMKNLGYVQRFGIGIPLAQRELKANGNPPAEFRPDENFVNVVVRTRS